MEPSRVSSSLPIQSALSLRAAFAVVLLVLAVVSDRADAQSQNDIDIRLIAPTKPVRQKPALATPHSGDSLGEVGADWARRQIHLPTDGADEKFLAETNERLDRFFGFTDLPDEARPNDNGHAASPNRAPASALKPHSLHMSKLGEFELAFGSNTKLHCDLVNGNELTLSKPIFQDIDLRLHHENTLNSVQLKFDW
jgi:hypothetical protein